MTAIRPAGGKYLQTKSGKTYYEYLPGTQAKTIVFVHGFAIPSGVWEKNFYFLNRHGYSVLRYDLYGRGRSRLAAKAPQTMALFLSQLKDLLNALNPPGPAALTGLSMGGAIAFRFWAEYPALAGSLCLISPMVQSALARKLRLMRLPVIGEFLAFSLARTIVAANVRQSVPLSPGDPDLSGEWIAQAENPAYRAALLSTIRHLLFQEGAYTYRPPAGARRPVCLIWGERDAVMPFSHADKVRQALGECEFHSFRGGGHCAPWERADEVNRILLEFLRGDEARAIKE